MEEGCFYVVSVTSRVHALEFCLFGSTECQGHLVEYSQGLDISKSHFPH